MRKKRWSIFLLVAIALASCQKNEDQKENPLVTEISTVGEVNHFVSGESVILSQQNVNQIASITLTKEAVEDANTLKNVFDLAFTFITQPRELSFKLLIPNNAGLTVVVERNGKWYELEHVTTSEGISTVHFEYEFLVSLTKALIKTELIRVALLDKSHFIQSYSIHKNYYDRNPLSALAVFEYHGAIKKNTMTIVGQNNNDIIKSFENDGAVDSISILGLYNNSDNTVEFALTNEKGTTFAFVQNIYCNAPWFNDITISTNFQPGFKNLPTELYWAISMPFNLTPTVYPSGDRAICVGYDQWGKVRMMLYTDGGNLAYPISYRGKSALIVVEPNNGNRFNVLDYDGKILMTDGLPPDLAATHYLHHECKVLDDNTLVFCYGLTTDDQYGIIEYDLSSKTFNNPIDLREIVTETRQIMEDWFAVNPWDVIHTNSVEYSKSDNSFIISMRHQGIVKIDRNTHRAKWLITPHIALNELLPGTQDKILTPINFDNTAEEWCLGQHTATLLPSGEIMCFDDHNDPVQDVNNGSRYSRIVTFEVNEENMTISKKWSYNTKDKKFSFYMGSAFLLPNGNVLGTWSTSQYASEVVYGTTTVVWESYFTPSNKRGDVYRTYKIDIY